MHACLCFFPACLWFCLAASLSICGLFSYASPSSSASQYALVYKGFSLHQDDLLYWQLPAQFTGDKVTENFGVTSGQPVEITESTAPLESSSLPTTPQPSSSLLSSTSHVHTPPYSLSSLSQSFLQVSSWLSVLHSSSVVREDCAMLPSQVCFVHYPHTHSICCIRAVTISQIMD